MAACRTGLDAEQLYRAHLEGSMTFAHATVLAIVLFVLLDWRYRFRQ